VRSAAVAPILLAIVAVAQIGLARTIGLTPWKGGGFGMFATLDHAAYRGIDIVVDAPERSESLEVAPSLELAAARAASFPAEWLLRDLAERVVARERRYQRPVAKVTLTVWRTDVDPATLRPSKHPFRTFVYDVP
jgi:hypothetical protein